MAREPKSKKAYQRISGSVGSESAHQKISGETILRLKKIGFRRVEFGKFYKRFVYSAVPSEWAKWFFWSV